MFQNLKFNHWMKGEIRPLHDMKIHPMHWMNFPIMLGHLELRSGVLVFAQGPSGIMLLLLGRRGKSRAIFVQIKGIRDAGSTADFRIHLNFKI